MSASMAVAGIGAGGGLAVTGCSPGSDPIVSISLPAGAHLLTHVLQPLFGEEEVAGRFYPASKSGLFRPLAPKAGVDDAAARMGEAAVAVIAGQAFVQDAAGQRLSFPVKRGGQLLSGGSGDLAPSTPLMALVWNGPEVAILPYDPATGAPLAGAEWPDGLVAPVLDETRAAADAGGSWQLMGLSGQDASSLHLVAGASGARADGLARLRGLGVAGPVISLGNSGAAMVWQPEPGFQLLPAPSGAPAAQNLDPAVAAPLPHYLAILSLA